VAIELALWTGLAVLAVVLVVAAARHADRLVPEPRSPAPRAGPTLFGLDLDPRSLPEDVVAAARDCFARGAAVEALSLLYRGALLHLTERRGLWIPDSATELECVRLVSDRETDEAARVFGDLTDIWVHARYAGQPPGPARFEDLCGRFLPVFGAPHEA
jgi:hypothetical protein